MHLFCRYNGEVGDVVVGRILEVGGGCDPFTSAPVCLYTYIRIYVCMCVCLRFLWLCKGFYIVCMDKCDVCTFYMLCSA